MYNLQVTKFVDNPNYEKELEEYDKHSRYNNCPDYPKQKLEERSLSVELTEDEFIKVKNAVLDNFI